MLYHLIKALWLILLGFLVPFYVNAAQSETAYPQNQKLYDLYPWSVMYYYGATFSDALPRMPTGDFHRWPEHIHTAELAYTLNEQNVVRQFFYPIVGVVQVAGNVTVRSGSNQNTIYQFDPYIMFRWANWPWNHFLTTSFALAEGVSYASAVPDVEKNTADKTEAKRFLNYVVIEATFSPPKNPRLQLVARVEHRSGAFGLYNAGNTGSNDLGIGIRYLFD